MRSVSVLIGTPELDINAKDVLREKLADRGVDNFDVNWADYPDHEGVDVLYIDSYPLEHEAVIKEIIQQYFHILEDDFNPKRDFKAVQEAEFRRRRKPNPAMRSLFSHMNPATRMQHFPGDPLLN